MGALKRLGFGGMLFGAALLTTALVCIGSVKAGSNERYPYDPVCPWGRIGDGHGMLIRCLAPKEASALLSGRGLPVVAAGKAKTERKKPVKTPADAQAGRRQSLKVVNIGPAKADTGELPLAVRKLSLPKDRYIACVKKHGGLTKKRGKVVVRFLVRERGRAEGVGVKSRDGMSVAAAECIADVVDRRYVGYPAAPIVGAELPIELSRKQ